MQRWVWIAVLPLSGAVMLAHGACAQGAPPAAPAAVAPAKKGAITGVVRARDGAPAAGVLVAAAPAGAEVELFPFAASARTDEQGRFRLELDPGLYCLAVSIAEASKAVGTAWKAGVRVESGAAAVEVELQGAEVDIPFAGEVLAPDRTSGAGAAGSKPAPGAFVHVERREDGVLLLAEADAAGKFALTLPRGTWRAFATGRDPARAGAIVARPDAIVARSEWQDRMGPAAHRLALVELAADPLAPAPEAAIAELKAALTGWKTDGLDVAALAAGLAGARVVGVGDGLRGTHEELAFGAQLFRALATAHGFRLVALDAPFGDAWLLNEWLLTGKGDVHELVRGLAWGGWDRAELVELLEWMRAWNADGKHAQKLQVVGLDVMHTKTSGNLLADYYVRVDDIAGPRFSSWMSAFRLVNDQGVPPYERFDDEERESLRLMIGDLVEVFPVEHERYTQKSTQAEYEAMHQHVRSLGACEEVLRLAGQGWTTRDRERKMPERLAWMLARCGEGAKALVWARNSVVGVQGEAEFGSLGWWLRHEHGPAYTTIGTCVGAGRALLPDGTTGAKGPPPAAELALAAPFPGTLEDALARTGAAGGVLDLGKLSEKGAARAWLASERARRSLVHAWTGEHSLYRRATVLGELDRLVWLRSATPARALPAK